MSASNFAVLFLLLSILSLAVCLPEAEIKSNQTHEDDSISAFQKINLLTQSLGYTKSKNEIVLKNVNFGCLGASGLTLNAKKPVGNATKIRIGNQEIVLATNFKTPSESDSLVINKAVNIEAGIHDVFITVPNDSNEIESIQFYTSKPNQETWYFLLADVSGKALDIGRGVRYGRMTQYKYRNEDNQKFRFKEIYTGYYKIEVKSSGLVLEVKDFGRGEYIRVQTNDYRGWDNQLWSIEASISGYVRIRAKHSTDCLDVDSASWDDGAVVNTHDCNGTPAQRWFLIPAC